MISHLSVCGDSFGIGVGISSDATQMIDKSFGGIVAANLNLPLKMYARSGCCNFVIYLQIKKIIKQYSMNKNLLPLVLVTTTHHSRFCFPVHTEPKYVEYDLSDVDYLTYSPFNNKEDYQKFLPFQLNNSPKIISETVSNVLHHNTSTGSSLGNLFKIVKKKLPSIKKYFEELYSDSIKLKFDYSLITMMHLELKEAGIPHLIMGPNAHNLRFIDSKNFFNQQWGYYSKKYPDIYKSGHCTETGHLKTAHNLLEKIKILEVK